MFTNNQIEVDALPKVETLDFKPIAKSYFNIILFNLVLIYGGLICVFIVIKIFTEKKSFHEVFWYFIGFFILLFFVQLFFFRLGFKKRRYALREKDITYSHGYIVNSITTLPFNRIQHLEIKKSFLARKLGLATLKIYSAGQSGGDLSIKGLPKEVADTQYAFLTNIINERS